MKEFNEIQELYKIYNKNNSLNQEIIDVLYENFEVLNSDSKHNINIISIFFHEIVVFLTSWVIIKNSDTKYLNDAKLPFVSSSFIEQKVPAYSFYNSPKIKWNKKIIFFSFLSKLVPFKKNISISNNIPVFFLNKIKFIFIFNYRLNLPSTSKIYFKDSEHQIEFLKNTINNISNENNLFINEYKINAFISYLSQFISHENLTFNDSFITGSNLNINNRILSANRTKNNKKVISSDHSKLGLKIINEPFCEYGEFAFLTDYFDNRKSVIDDKNIRFSPKIHIHNNSINLREISKNINLNEKKLKYLYIPTSLGGNYLYGPYRNFEDNLYIKWQLYMLNFYSDLDITVKAHPKSKVDIKYADTLNVIYGNLEEQLKNFDVIILDYISSSFATSMLSGLPVIFLDLNARDINRLAISDIKKSCYYYNINLNNDLANQLKSAYENFVKFDNLESCNFNKKYLYNKKSSTIKKVLKILNEK